jgi:hypothetical protein
MTTQPEVRNYQVQNGVLRNVHPIDTCIGEHCTIHRPSDHAMVTWPQQWNPTFGVMERVCEHGAGHLDPDDLTVTLGTPPPHECDGCCTPIEVALLVETAPSSK